MIYQGCNGTMMLSSESEVVWNNFAYSQLEKFLITLSAKYGLGEILFLEKNPKNNNATDSFYIRAPKDWSVEQIFEEGKKKIEELQRKMEEENQQVEENENI